MADTIPRITVNTTWQAVSALTTLTAGTAIKIQHVGGNFVDIVIDATIPTSATGTNGEQIRTGGWFTVAAGENDVWVKTSSPTLGLTASLSVQANA